MQESFYKKKDQVFATDLPKLFESFRLEINSLVCGRWLASLLSH